MKKCPYCAEEIIYGALVCPHCKREVYKRKGWGRIGCGLFIFFCAPVFYIVLLALLGPLAFIAPSIVGIVGSCFIASGIHSLVKVGKPKPSLPKTTFERTLDELNSQK